MATSELYNKVNEPQLTQLIDNVLDAVLGLKARLAGFEHGFEFHWGYSNSPLLPYNIPMDTRPRTKALKAEQLKGELKGDLATYEKFGLFQWSVNQNTAYRYRGVLLRYQLFLGENPPSLAATQEYLGLLC
jgi:hypothetical protein